MRILKLLAFGIGVAACGVSSASSFTTLTIPTLNTDIRTWTNGGAYNTLYPSSLQTLAGVPFSFQSDANGHTAFGGEGSINFPGGMGPASVSIPVSVYGVSDVYMLINTAWGSAGVNVGSVTFNGGAGTTYTVDLVEGVNVRDHYYGNFVNTTSAPNVTQAVWGLNSPGHAHLDMQTFTLPVAFHSQTLSNIVFNSTGGSQGSPFIAAATVAPVPEVETYFMMLLGLGLIGLSLRHRNAHAVK